MINKLKKAILRKWKQGASLIEMLIVVAILGTIYGMVFIGIQNARAMARDAKRVGDLHQLNIAMESYYLDNGEYPSWTGSGTGFENDSGTVSETGFFGISSVFAADPPLGSDAGVCMEEGEGYTQLTQSLVNGGYITYLPQDPKYNSQDCGFDGQTTYPEHSGCHCFAYKTETVNGKAARYKVFAVTERDNGSAKNDAGVSLGMYEVYGPDASSSQITFPGIGSACTPSWQCNSWSDCASSTQTRICLDYNNCATNEGKPDESQSCSCVPNWQCESWSNCASSTQTRACTDGNNCETQEGKPAESQSCCTPSWQCNSWSSCASSTQTRACTDENNCGTNENKPDESQSCCSPSWQCESWSNCASSTQTRACTDGNNCGTQEGKPAESQSCTCTPNWQCNSWSSCQSGQETRTCADANTCGTQEGKPAELRLCSSCSSCTTKSANSVYQCNADGTSSGSGAYMCTCLLNLNTECMICRNAICEYAETGTNCPADCDPQHAPGTQICSNCNLKAANSVYRCNSDGTLNSSKGAYNCTCTKNYFNECTIVAR